MTIPAYRLPEGIERGSGYGPMWRNVIQESIAGTEQRFAQWTNCRGVGDLSYGLLTSSDPLGDYAAILAIWRAHRGSLYPFRFRNWGDYTADDEIFGTGDGSETEFQLVKTYDPCQILLNTPGDLFYVREITLPVLTGLTIEVDGTPQTIVTDYTITETGLVTFTTPPTNTKLCTWGGEFDDLVRFDIERLPIILNESDLTAIGSMAIKEVIGES